ncbi:helix-turn-helix domain-containing protein [Formosa sp. PL04]|uniref:helix-turn-helix domain-containing protein n=1 Tax=Formosa sp. PL04 TaxID=3081755 RepID=UPI0029816522|nr:helix-turn-helix domain-containing protein [Formosa sp. PL04]MDW5288158.1 helix-turn-helix domain-containing protein [Formosa sp. PL04]
MSINLEVQRICESYKVVFIAKTTKTKYCSLRCNSRHYKEKTRSQKITISNKESVKTATIELQILKLKEFLTVKEASVLLNCSKRSVYSYIKSDSIISNNFGQRLLRIRRVDLEDYFNRK